VKALRPQDDVTVQMAERRRLNRMAERDVADWLYARYLNPQAGTETRFAAEIIDVSRGGMRVRLVDNGAVAFIPAPFLHAVRDEMVCSQENGTVQIKGEVAYKVTDVIDVTIAEVRMETAALSPARSHNLHKTAPSGAVFLSPAHLPSFFPAKSRKLVHTKYHGRVSGVLERRCTWEKMTKSLAQNLLDPNSGETSLYWRLSRDNPTLRSSASTRSNAEFAITLSEDSTRRIQAMTVTTSSVAVNIQLNGYDVPVHLIGRVELHRVGGTASSWFDTSSVARDLLQGLLFAEQVVSEANAVIVILDRDGKIQRFNRLCEEYSGLKEQDVIGKTAFELFMTATEAAARGIT
jgi:PAS domain-containing protein